MPLKNGSFFKPANGRYIQDFLGTEDGPRFDRKKDDGTIKNEGTILWNFALFNQDGTPVVDPGTGDSPARAQGMTSETVGVGSNGVPAKGRQWLTALLAARGLVFDDNVDPNLLVQRCIGARTIGNYGRSPKGGKDGTLLSVEPTVSQVVDSGPVTVSMAPGATATIPAVAYASASVSHEGPIRLSDIPDDLPF